MTGSDERDSDVARLAARVARLEQRTDTSIARPESSGELGPIVRELTLSIRQLERTIWQLVQPGAARTDDETPMEPPARRGRLRAAVRENSVQLIAGLLASALAIALAVYMFDRAT